MSDVPTVKKNIHEIFERRKAAVFATSQQYAQLALQYFKRHQSRNAWWHNQSSDAMNLMFTRSFKEGEYVGWLMAHGVSYGVYLELANNGRRQAIKPVITIYAKKFMDAVDDLYSGDQKGKRTTKSLFEEFGGTVSEYVKSRK